MFVFILLYIIISAIVIAAVAWAKIERPSLPLTEGSVRHYLAVEFPELTIARVWVDSDGLSAVAKVDSRAVIVFRFQDVLVSRFLSWSEIENTNKVDDQIQFKLNDPSAPVATFRAKGMAWPPHFSV